MYKGIVEDNQDPDKYGRVKVRIFGVHSEDATNIPTTALPWAEVVSSTVFSLNEKIGITSIIRIGTWVWVDFLGGDVDMPVVTGVVTGKGDMPEDNYSETQIISTSSGHKIELSDVEDDTHIIIKHRSGTTIKLSDDGSCDIVCTKLTLDSSGDVDIFGDGDVNIGATGDVNITSSNINLNQ